jgi:hypothetical protein
MPMNVTKELFKERGYSRDIALNEELLWKMFSAVKVLCSFKACQYEDYSKVMAPRFDPQKRAARRAEVFPCDGENAFNMEVWSARCLCSG